MRHVWALALCFFFTATLSAATFTVDDLGDAADATPGNGTCATAGAVCTLRAAIQEANALAGADIIELSVAGTISPATALPAITQQVTIDGTTAPGYTTAPVVAVFGAGSLVTGFNFSAGSSNSILRGVKVHGFTASGVSVSSDDVGIYNNHLGPVGGGTPNMDGISLFGNGTLIGSNDGVSGNVLSGNTRFGILAGGSTHEIAGNYIGTDATGMAALPNGDDGVRIFALASDITVGGFAPGADNVISGNGGDGIEINNGSNNRVAANFIGLDATGAAALANGGSGVRIENANGNSVGTGDSRTYISGNTGEGVWIVSGEGNFVVNSTIGLATDGATPVPNANGVVIEDDDNTVDGNVISGNKGDGVAVRNGAANAAIVNNFIGTDDAGLTSAGNSGNGVSVAAGSDAVTVGTTGGGNLISGNGLNGITATGATNLQIGANRIGLADDDSILGNGASGIALTGVTIAALDANTVSGNSMHGIALSGTTGVTIVNHSIGTDTLGTGDRGNLGSGLLLTNALNTTATTNVIAFNGFDGVTVTGTSSGNTFVNRTFDNGALGIDLNDDGVTMNDPLDADAGPNALQNFPDLAGANTAGISGTIHTTANTSVTLHFYSSPAADPSGYGEGVTLHGNTTVMTDALGNAPFSFGIALTAGHFVTATATANNDTSEFSQAVIVNAAPVVGFDLANYTFAENAGNATIVVTRSGDTTGTSTVDYTTANGTATAGSDYTATSGTLTFAPGVTSQNILVPIANDTTDEPAEAFTVTLSNATGATIGAASTTVEITDDDPQPTIAIGDVTQAESTSPFAFDVTLSNPSTSTITVDYATANGTATAGSDYTAASGTLTFAPGVTTQTINVAVTNDATSEPDETFFVNLTNATNATIGDTQSTGTIADDEALPVINISDVSDAENAGTFTFNVTLTAPSASTITVDYATANGTAAAGSDYTAASGTITFAPGVTAQTIDVTVIDDAIAEADETFVVDLTNPANATIGDAQGTGTITNDDAAAPGAAQIPTLSEWSLIALAMMLGLLALPKMR